LAIAGPASAQTSPAAPKPATLWPELLQFDAARAYQAMRQLAAVPGETLSFLREAAPAAKRTATDKQIEDLIRQLDSDRFAEREKACEELEALDWQATPALRKALEAGGTLEFKRRLEQLISRAEGPPTGMNLRWHRAVELVEWIGTAEAKALLETWSKGAAGSPLTLEANKAIKRWNVRNHVDMPDKRPSVDAAGDPLPAGALLRLGSTRWRMARGMIGLDRGGVLYTADAKKLIVAGENAIGIMDASTGKVLMRRAHRSHISGMQLSPDGHRLFLSGVFFDDKMRTPFLHVWDAADLKDIAAWVTEGSIEGFAADGKEVVLATEKGIRRLDAATGQEIAFTPFAKGVEGTVRAFNGKTIVVVNQRSRLTVFDLSEPEKGRNLETPDRAPRSVALSADGKYLAIGGDYDYSVLIYDLVRGEPIRYISRKDSQRDFISDLTFAPDSKTLAFSSGHDKPVLVLWDLETHRPRWKVAGHAGQLVFSPDGKFIAGNGGWRTRVWDAATGKELSAIDESAVYERLAFSADGRKMVTVHSDTVRLLEFPSGKELMRFAHPKVYRAALSPDARQLATSDFNHDLRIWDAHSGREVSRLPDGGWQAGHARSFTFTSDSRRLCTWEADYRLLVWDVTSGRLLADHRPRPEGFPKDSFDDDAPRRRRDREKELFHLRHWFCFSPDGSQFIWHFKKLRAYDTATGKVLRTYDEELNAGFYRAQMSHDGELLLVGGGNGSVILNVRQGRKIGQLPLPARDGDTYALAPDGRSFAVQTSLHGQRRITLFETATLEPRLVIPLEYSRAYDISFSPDSRLLAVRMSDRTAVIWDLRAPGI
jgi:WD40 repeat protein